MPYFSQRLRNSKQLNLELSSDFWTAFYQYIKNLSESEYFTKSFGYECRSGNLTGLDYDILSNELKIELGNKYWSKIHVSQPSTNEALDFIEFFYNNISEPINYKYCPECHKEHPNKFYDEKGKNEYESEVNRMFENFGHPYKLENGIVMRIYSTVLDEISEIELDTKDVHLIELIDLARSDFYSRDGMHKLNGLKTLVDVFERVKTIHQIDKKQSINKVLETITADSITRNDLEQEMKELTDIANNRGLRHTETNQNIITEESYIEYLFYRYFNLINLILLKHNILIQ